MALTSSSGGTAGAVGEQGSEGGAAAPEGSARRSPRPSSALAELLLGERGEGASGGRPPRTVGDFWCAAWGRHMRTNVRPLPQASALPQLYLS